MRRRSSLRSAVHEYLPILPRRRERIRESAARLRPQPKHPERMKVNSRGRAALREAHGRVKQPVDPERVKQTGWFDPFRVESYEWLGPWASRKVACTRLLTPVPSGPRKSCSKNIKFLTCCAESSYQVTGIQRGTLLQKL